MNKKDLRPEHDETLGAAISLLRRTPDPKCPCSRPARYVVIGELMRSGAGAMGFRFSCADHAHPVEAIPFRILKDADSGADVRSFLDVSAVMRS